MAGAAQRGKVGVVVRNPSPLLMRGGAARLGGALPSRSRVGRCGLTRPGG